MRRRRGEWRWWRRWRLNRRFADGGGVHRKHVSHHLAHRCHRRSQHGAKLFGGGGVARVGVGGRIGATGVGVVGVGGIGGRSVGGIGHIRAIGAEAAFAIDLLDHSAECLRRKHDGVVCRVAGGSKILYHGDDGLRRDRRQVWGRGGRRLKRWWLRRRRWRGGWWQRRLGGRRRRWARWWWWWR